jgi:hypothetical protein
MVLLLSILGRLATYHWRAWFVGKDGTTSIISPSSPFIRTAFGLDLKGTLSTPAVTREPWLLYHFLLCI